MALKFNPATGTYENTNQSLSPMGPMSVAPTAPRFQLSSPFDIFRSLLPLPGFNPNLPSISPSQGPTTPTVPQTSVVPPAVNPAPITPVSAVPGATQTAQSNPAPSPTPTAPPPPPENSVVPPAQPPAVLGAQGMPPVSATPAAPPNPFQQMIENLQNLTPEQKQLLGFAETPQQTEQRTALTASLNKLIALQNQLVSASAPQPQITNLNNLIADQQRQLDQLQPSLYYQNNPGLANVGITQSQLERTVAKEREPISIALANLLTSKSILSNLQNQQVGAIQGQIGGIQTEMDLRNALASLSPNKALPTTVQSDILKGIFITPQEKLDTQLKQAQLQKTLAETRNLQGGVFGEVGGGSVQTNTQGIPDPQQQEQFLASLPSGTASLIKSIADYKADISKVTSLRGGHREQIAALVTQYDPTFDMTQYQARAAMRKSITSGTYSQTINSSNLVIQHLDALNKAVDDLGNTSLPLVNAVKNKVLQQTGSPVISRFETTSAAVASELAKVFKGTGQSDLTEIKNWRDQLNINGSPKQLKASVQQLVGNLLASRLDTIRNQYQSTMGKPVDFSFLTPHSREILQNMGISPDTLDQGTTQGGPQFMRNADGSYTRIK